MARFDEWAVSPVVGVMLMLVVTLIIASVVSAFAGGLWGNNEKAPVVTIQATINSSDNYNVTLTDMGGDPFQVRDVKLIIGNDSRNIVFTNNTSSSTNLFKVYYDGDPAPGLIRAGDKLLGYSPSNTYFVTGNEYKWSLVHIPSQNTIATGKVYT
jgi:archaeal type IV pilus assembly protein PilA